MAKKKEIDYSFWIGLFKGLKNTFIIFAPAFVAFLMNVPEQYTPIASVIAYMLKNYYEIKSGNKLL